MHEILLLVFITSHIFAELQSSKPGEIFTICKMFQVWSKNTIHWLPSME